MALASPVLTFILDTRHVFTPYEKADFKDVMPQINSHGITEESIWILPGWSNLENSMTIRTDNNEVAEKLEGLNIYVNHPVLGKQCFIIEKKADFVKEDEEPLEDIKIVFKNCCTGELLFVKNERFDAAMKRLWGITLKYCTEMERRYDGSPTSNRFCVIKGIDLEKLSLKFDRFSVQNPELSRSYNLKVEFDGKLNICRCCRDVHRDYCPLRNKYFQLKKQKENLVQRGEVIINMFSDSQLRYVENIGIAANVTCSSGATIGQIANIMRDHPRKNFQNVVIVMGANNIDDTKSEELFRSQTAIEVQRLIASLKGKAFRHAVIVPGLRDTDDACKKHQMAILEEILQNETINDRSITIHSVDCEKIQFDPESEVHASREGTRNVLRELSEISGLEGMFIDKQFSVVFPKKNIYTGVSSVYKFGCRFCETTYFVKEGFCDGCKKDGRFENIISKEISWE